MKKLLLTFALFSTSLTSYAAETILIGASPVPHAEMLRQIKPILAKQGYDLQIKEFTDYVTPNLALNQKQLDANFFQHAPYLAQYNKDHDTHLISLVAVDLEPMGIYANTKTETKLIKSKKALDITKGSKVGVPNDPTNEGRALNLLQANGFIKIKSQNAYPTRRDIIANPYKLEILELDPAMLARALNANQLSLAVINSNYALMANLNPIKNSLFIESNNSPFANIIAIRAQDANTPKMKALAKAMTSPAMKQFIQQKYNGAIIPVF